MTMSFTRSVSFGGEGCQHTLTGDGEGMATLSITRGVGLGGDDAGAHDGSGAQSIDEEIHITEAGASSIGGTGLRGKGCQHADRSAWMSEAYEPNASGCGSTAAGAATSQAQHQVSIEPADSPRAITEAHASSIGAHPGPVGRMPVTVAVLIVVVAAVITLQGWLLPSLRSVS